VRFPWQRDVGALSRNSGIVQHCCVSFSNATIETEGLSTSSMVTHATIDARFYGIRNSTDMTSRVWKSLGADVFENRLVQTCLYI
jgi:hypothetical protein